MKTAQVTAYLRHKIMYKGGRPSPAHPVGRSEYRFMLGDHAVYIGTFSALATISVLDKEGEVIQEHQIINSPSELRKVARELANL